MEENRITHTYLAVTIGPIVKTLLKARSTKELWAASYFISYLMKQLVISFKDSHTFISPLADDVRLFEPHEGAGLFPDRLIFKRKNENDFDILTQRIDRVIEEVVNGKENRKGIAEEINDQLIVDHFTAPKNERPKHKPPAKTQVEILRYFKNYLKIYALEIELDEGENVRQRIDQYLTVLELQNPLPPPESVDYLATLFRGVYGRKSGKNRAESMGSLFLDDGFGPRRKRPFPSLFEIATSEFFRDKKGRAYTHLLWEWLTKTQEISRQLIKEDKEDKTPQIDITNQDDKLLKDVKTLMGDAFRRRHKYIAIVQADGDGMGKVNAAIFEGRSTEESEKLLADVDGQLLQFSLSAIDTIHAFGGRPIYLGGDDLLFFAPVMGHIGAKQASVFELVKTLSTAFDDAFHDEKYSQILGVRPTLSFGVSISYYKYPMFEALSNARHLLEDVAKKVKDKNALAFQILKHSGQEFGTAYYKEGKVFRKHIVTLFNWIPDNDEAFLTSVQYVLTNQQDLLCSLLNEYRIAQTLPRRIARLYLLVIFKRRDRVKKRLKNFFKNNFNEPVHSQKETFLLTVADLLFDAYAETQKSVEAIKMAHATLRFVQFLHQPDLKDDE